MSEWNVNQMTPMLENDSIDLATRNLLGEKLGIDAHLIQSNMSFRNDLGIDSLDFVEIIAEIEKKYRFRFSDEDLENLPTVQSLIVYIKNKI